MVEQKDLNTQLYVAVMSCAITSKSSASENIQKVWNLVYESNAQLSEDQIDKVNIEADKFSELAYNNFDKNPSLAMKSGTQCGNMRIALQVVERNYSKCPEGTGD